jgi:uncharacterized membrane protein YqiK
MWTIAVILLGLTIAVGILSTIPRLARPLRPVAGGAALLVVALAIFGASFRYVGENQVGIIVKNVGASLPSGQIIATAGEKGPQARVLPPGWHPWLWPVIYDVQVESIIEIDQDEVGIITTTDGQPLPDGQVYAPEWSDDQMKRMADAEYFLTEGGGFKGPQTTVLTPGKHRLNTRLFRVEKHPVTNIAKAEVGVVKSNVGRAPVRDERSVEGLVPRGTRGIWSEPYGEGKYYLNPKAYEVTIVSTRERTIQYTKGSAQGEEREINVRSSDGFTFPVDVRVEYEIRPEDAPLIVANFQDAESDSLKNRLHSSVRSVFRNNAESLKALDYVNSRSQQEVQSRERLIQEVSAFGLSINGVRIGDVGDELSLGTLLKTQTDRELAIQQQITFQEQQRAAEQRKALTRTEQEAEEERRLATAQYEVQIAGEQKQQRIIGAEAQAESIRIEAEAQAEAFRVIAQQIGAGNAALMEMLKVIGERGIQITPRVMVSGERSGEGSAETTALIGTMLDSMVSRDTAGAPN